LGEQRRAMTNVEPISEDSFVVNKSKMNAYLSHKNAGKAHGKNKERKLV
jgi:hypothetical protein